MGSWLLQLVAGLAGSFEGGLEDISPLVEVSLAIIRLMLCDVGVSGGEVPFNTICDRRTLRFSCPPSSKVH